MASISEITAKIEELEKRLNVVEVFLGITLSFTRRWKERRLFVTYDR